MLASTASARAQGCAQQDSAPARRPKTPSAGAVLHLEAIGYTNWKLCQPQPPTGIWFIDILLPDEWSAPRWWVAEIGGYDQQYGFKRRFLRPHYDFSRANSVGSRGVYAVYILDEGGCYDVKSPRTWKKNDRYLCIVRDGEIVKTDEEGVRQCLKSRWAVVSSKPRSSE